MRAKLSDLSVRALPPGTYMDERTPAFGIRVGKSRRTWIVVKGKGRVKHTVGHYPDMSLAEARKHAVLSLAQPSSTKPTISFEEAKEAFLSLPRWRFHSKRVLTSSLKHFTWKRPVDKITHEDIAQAIEAIEAPSARAHALKDIRTFFNWLVPRYLSSSPAVGLKMPPQKPRDRILTPEELKAVWNACEGTFGTIVRLLILTGARKSEITTLQWSDVGDDTITIRAEVAKNGHELVLPIGPTAQALLPPRGNGYVFRSSDGEGHYNGHAYHYAKLLKASGTKDWTIHDLRRSYVSMHSQIGTPIHIAERMVNHISGSHGGIRRVYDRWEYRPEMRSACEAIEAHILSVVSD